MSEMKDVVSRKDAMEGIMQHYQSWGWKLHEAPDTIIIVLTQDQLDEFLDEFICPASVKQAKLKLLSFKGKAKQSKENDEIATFSEDFATSLRSKLDSKRKK